jgi:hypothetical protein
MFSSYPLEDLAGGGPLFWTRSQAIAVWSLARFRRRASAATSPTAACKLLGFSFACHAICTERIAKNTHARAVDIYNALNDNAPEEKNPAAQFKLNQRIWNALIRPPN